MTDVVVDSVGPGRRAVVWVRGCPFRCAGCVAPEWIPFGESHDVDPIALAGQLLEDPGVVGLTFSGGEPMAQAAGLAAVAVEARRIRPVSVVCFTGHRLETLRSRPPGPGVAALLAEVDVLIDGQYVAALNDGRGLRGSSNQRVHLLTDRLADCGFDFAGRPRTAEIRVSAGSVRLVGVPPPGVLDAFERVAGWAGGGQDRPNRILDGGSR